MHHKTSGSKALCLLFLNAGDFFFGVADGSVMFLRFLLHNLILKKLLIHLKFLTVTGYAGLAGVNWALDRCNHIQENGVVLGIADVVEPLVLECLLTSHAFCGVHLQEATHKIQCLFRKAAHVPLLESFGSSYIRKFETIKSWIFFEAFLLLFSERPKDFLD